jgi:hypothetical protein
VIRANGRGESWQAELPGLGWVAHVQRLHFDALMHGNAEAISRAAQRGAGLFVAKGGCVICHGEPLLSDQRNERLTRIELERPVAIVGVRTRPTSISIIPPGSPHDGVITLIGYDSSEQVADVAMAVYPATAREAFQEMSTRERFLAVEGCEGASLARVEIRTSEFAVEIVEIDLLW